METARRFVGSLFGDASPLLISVLLFSGLGTLIVAALPDVFGFANLLVIPGLLLSLCVTVFFPTLMYAVTRYWILPRLAWAKGLSRFVKGIFAAVCVALILVAVPLLAQADAHWRVARLSLEEMTPPAPIALSGHVRVEGLHGGDRCQLECRRLLRVPGVRSVTLTRYANIPFDRIRDGEGPTEFGFTNTFLLKRDPACRARGAQVPQYGEDPCVIEGLVPSRFDFTIRTGVYSEEPLSLFGIRRNVWGNFLMVLAGEEVLARRSAAWTTTLKSPMIIAPTCGEVWAPRICAPRFDIGLRESDSPDISRFVAL